MTLKTWRFAATSATPSKAPEPKRLTRERAKWFRSSAHGDSLGQPISAHSADGLRIIGQTPVGRATVKALQLNRHSLLIARQTWVQWGVHPPLHLTSSPVG